MQDCNGQYRLRQRLAPIGYAIENQFVKDLSRPFRHDAAEPRKGRPDKNHRIRWGLGRAFSRNIGPGIGYALVAYRTFMVREKARHRPQKHPNLNYLTSKFPRLSF